MTITVDKMTIGRHGSGVVAESLYVEATNKRWDSEANWNDKDFFFFFCQITPNPPMRPYFFFLIFPKQFQQPWNKPSNIWTFWRYFLSKHHTLIKIFLSQHSWVEFSCRLWLRPHQWHHCPDLVKTAIMRRFHWCKFSDNSRRYNHTAHIQCRIYSISYTTSSYDSWYVLFN